MPPKPLSDPIFDQDVRRVNFFNGRLLSGEDLSHEQDANQQAIRRLGLAVGDGVAWGLEVTPTPGVDRVSSPTLHVAAGLAVNRRGETLWLADAIDLALTQLPAATGSSSAPIQTFSVCEPPDGSIYVAGAGLYVLTVGSVEGRSGRAPVSGLGNIVAACNTQYLVPGVRFRLIRVELRSDDLNAPATLRNRLAYRCFLDDPSACVGVWTNPFGPPVTTYGLLDSLRPNRLQPCEVPLALVYLTASEGLVFVDMWSARRRIIAPAADRRFGPLTSDRRAAEGEAMVAQFHAQVEDLLASTTSLQAVVAADQFAFLPPVGLLPVATGALSRGFSYATFFSGMTYRPPVTIEGAQLRSLFQEAIDYPPIDTSSRIVVWLYLVRENAQAALGSAQPPQAYLVFASGHTAYRGEARYDVNRWNFGNFS